MNKERLMQVLLGPVISEKSTNAADAARQFVFQVVPDATKPEIKKAVELMFDVSVQSVRVVNIKGKAKRFGASWVAATVYAKLTSSWLKAVISILVQAPNGRGGKNQLERKQDNGNR